ncbi:phosphotransferase [soil metagenome]
MTTSSLDWLDPVRASAFAQWLAAVSPQHALQPDTVRLASADASFRRYFRIDAAGGSQSFIIMDAPPAQEDCAPFVKVAGLMADASLKAPRVLAWSEPLGFMLLSDLGARTMLDVIAPPAAVDARVEATTAHFDLFMQAVDVLVQWQLASKPGVLPPYDDALLSRELALFPEWYVGQHRGFALDATLMGKLDPLFAQIKASNLNALDGARVYVHRDFMPRNLMVDKSGELGVLDFQDAVYGPITYDIASLLRDAFLSWEEEFVLDITVRYWQRARKAGLPVGDDFGEFYRAVEWMGLQRHLKVLGIFARLSLRDGKPKYLADTPRFIRYARATCARYRQLGPLMVLLDEIEGNETRVGYTF